MAESLWRTLNYTRHFIIPDAERHPPGDLEMQRLSGETIQVDPAWAARFEVSEAEARAWAQAEFGFVLDQMRHRIDTRMARARAALDSAKAAPVSPNTTIAPDAVPATWELFCKMPRAILDALSGDAARVAGASEALRASEQQLGKAGVDVAPGLSAFADRLAALRRDYEATRQKPPA
ncbi:MAG: hypothetical protein ACK5SX_04245 [Sandaracinobacter sp.]